MSVKAFLDELNDPENQKSFWDAVEKLGEKERDLYGHYLTLNGRMCYVEAQLSRSRDREVILNDRLATLESGFSTLRALVEHDMELLLQKQDEASQRLTKLESKQRQLES